MKNQLALTLLLPWSLLGIAQHEDTPPNILVFIADDAGMDFGCYGNEGIKTPNIDALAADGMICQNAFLTASQCSPSRASILTGKYAHSIGAEDLHMDMEAGHDIVPHYLAKQGYYSGIMLKGHIGERAMSQFDWNDKGGEDYGKGLWNDKVLSNFQQFLDKTGDRPFFMWTGFIDPHRPYTDPVNGAPAVHSKEDVRVPPFLVDGEGTREDLADYYDEIHRMDRHIGMMLDELKRRGLYENTLIIFFSDNGFPFPRGKATLYDSGIQTPLIFSWKDKIAAGTSYEGLMSLIDLAPTLLDVAGCEIPSDYVGESFRGIFSDLNAKGRDYIFAERNWHDTDAHMRCVRSGKYKLIMNSYIELPFPIIGDLWRSESWLELLEGRKNQELTAGQAFIFTYPRYRFELYDIEKDPFELNNLTTNPDYFNVMEELNHHLLRWIDETGDYPPYEKRRMDLVDRHSGFFYDVKKYRYHEHYDYYE